MPRGLTPRRFTCLSNGLSMLRWQFQEAWVALAGAAETVGTASQWQFGAGLVWAAVFGLLAYALYRRVGGREG